ncbi:MAG: hypothetical protein KA314_00460 [Chloroflexi bacterium]|nr:hypothetical protein [Chloroflexota bacterium]MBP8054278.1 hypothetical protein [Chloroflexota bacterium]
MPQTATQIYQPTQCKPYGVLASRPQSQPGFQGSWHIEGVDAGKNAPLSSIGKTRPIQPDRWFV